jgi:putative sporulation protein YtaF
MSDLMSLLILSIAVSLDSFGVGVTYGMRRISINFISLAIITLCTALTLLIAMVLGDAVSHLLPLEWAQRLGGVIIFAIGAIAVVNNFRSRRQQTVSPSPSARETRRRLKNNRKRSHWLNWKPIKVILDIWESPLAADFDNSGSISNLEALALGISVSLDSFLAGIGAALMGLSIWQTTVIIAGMSGFLIYLGLQVGIVLASNRLLNRLSYLPGLLLIMLGISKFV